MPVDTIGNRPTTGVGSTDLIQGSHLKKLMRHGALYLLASLLMKGGAAVLLPVYTYFLPPREYAVFSNLMAFGALLGVVLSLQVDFVYTRLYFDAVGDLRRARRMFSTLLWFLLAWGGLVAVLAFYVARAQLTALLGVPALPYVALACAIPLATQLNELAATHFRSQHRSALVTGVMAAGFLLSAGVSVGLLLATALGPAALLYGTLAGAALIACWYLVILGREGLIGWEFSPALLKESLVYAVGLLPIASSAWIAGQLDKLLITWFGTLADSGVFSVAFEIGRVMNMFVVSLFMAYGPMIYAMLKDDPRKNVIRIEQFQAFYLHILLGMALFISVLSPEIFRLLLEAKYRAGVTLVPVIAFAFVFSGIRKLHATLLFHHKLTWLISVGGIGQAVFSFGLNVLLIPHFGGAAAAWSRLVGTAAVTVYFWALCRRYQPLRLDRGALGITLATTAVCLALLGLCTYVFGLGFWSLLGAKLAIAALALGITWRSRFGDDLRKTLFPAKRRAAQADVQPADTGATIAGPEEVDRSDG